MPLSLNSRFCGNVYIIQCKGRIVAGDEVSSLEREFDLGARGFSRLVLHVSEVDRLDSTGIGLLVRYAANTRKRGGDMRLAAPPPFVVNLLDVTKLSGVLQIHATEEDAIVSFLKERAPQTTPGKAVARVLLLDQSADLCAFVRTVLMQHGFDVKSTNRLSDAKILLRVDKMDYILLGPNTSQFSSETVLRSLKALAPSASAFHLGADFNCRDAHQATEALLRLFGANSASASSKSATS